MKHGLILLLCFSFGCEDTVSPQDPIIDYGGRWRDFEVQDQKVLLDLSLIRVIDDDCDGFVDEGVFPIGSECVSGFGVCERSGQVVCGEGGVKCNATEGLPLGQDANCDGVDDDCDGLSDEHPPCNGVDMTRYPDFDGRMPSGWVGLAAGLYKRGVSRRDSYLASSAYEEPLHSVEFTRDILISQIEVPQEQFEDVMGYNPSFEVGPYRPVERVSWWEAIVFTNRLSELEGLSACYILLPPCSPEDALMNDCRDDSVECSGHFSCQGVELNPLCTGYRLPTDAEWEAAARARTDNQYWFDLTHSDDRYRFGINPRVASAYERCATGQDIAYKVASLPHTGQNPFGLYDMLGNVREWVFDVLSYHPDYGVVDPVVEFDEGFEGRFRVVRGGYFAASILSCRASLRGWESARTRQSFLGFRIVRVLTHKENEVDELK